VVATGDLEYGTKLTDAHLRIVSFPEESVPKGAFTAPDSLLGLTTKIFVKEGEPLLAVKLSELGGGLSVRIPSAMRATSVDVNEISGVSGFVLPGDRVDVLVTVDNAKGQNNAVTKLIVQNVEVLAAGVKTQTKNDKPVKVQSVTLQVSPDQAEKLALAINEGKIHLVLRNPGDHELVKESSTDTKTLLGLNQKRTVRRPRPKPKPPEPKPEPEPEPVIEEKTTVTIYKGTKEEKKEFPNESQEKGKDSSGK
jgi:pilus assembly protein CpaB